MVKRYVKVSDWDSGDSVILVVLMIPWVAAIFGTIFLSRYCVFLVVLWSFPVYVGILTYLGREEYYQEIGEKRQKNKDKA